MTSSDYNGEMGVGVRMGLPKSLAEKPFFKWSVRLLLAWTVATLVAPANLVACACSEMVLGSATVRSSLNVDSSTVILNLTQGDIELPGIIPVNLTRLYAGDDTDFTMFGFGWEFADVSYVKSISGNNGDVQIMTAGHLDTFRQFSGYYSEGETKKLTFVSSDEVKVVDKQGSEWHYNVTDRTLTYRLDSNGNRVDYTWKVITLPYAWMDPAPSGDDIPRVYCPLTATYPDGRQITFTYSTDAGYEYLCTQATSPSGFTVNYTYTNGLLTGISKSNSQFLNYDYNTLAAHGQTKGWLTKITYASGAEVNITWNGNYQNPDKLAVISVSGPNGYIHNFTHSDNTVTNVTVNGESVASHSLRTQTTNLSDSNSHVTSYKTETDAIADISAAAQQNISSLGLILGQLHAAQSANVSHGHAPPPELMATMALCQNNATAYTTSGLQNLSDSLTQLKKVESFNNDGSEGQVGTALTILPSMQQSLADALGRVASSSTAKKTKDALNYESSQLLNTKNRVGSVVNNRGKASLFTYDENNTSALSRDNRLNTTDPLGHQTTFEYDANNDLTKSTDALSRATTLTYDSHSNLTQVKNGLNQSVATMTYTGQGLLETIKDGLNNQTSFTYDTNGFRTKTTDALSKDWTYTYDNAGNLLTSTTPLGHATTYTYNGFYKVATATDALGNQTGFDYDEMANLKKITDALGHETNKAYDLLQRVTSITDALSYTTTFTYDAETNLTKLTDALGHDYTYSFDAVNQTKTFGFPDSSSESYDYDANGNLTKRVDRAGKETDYAYDDADRLTTKTWKLGGSATNVFAYTYNNADQLTGISLDGTAKMSYTYDGAARLTSVTSDGRTVGYAYDGAQNLSEVTYPSGTVADYVFDVRNQLSQLKKDTSIISAYTYDDDGRLIKKQLGNGLEQVYSYDIASRVMQIEVHEIAVPANVRQRFGYGYDAVGNRLYTKYLNGRGDVYNYDATYQLIGVKYDVTDPTAGYATATGASRTVIYNYDAVGNRTSVVDGAATTTYTINNLNQYTSTGGTNYTYSTRGELAGDGTWTYTYDQEKHLIGASKTGMAVGYGYDVLGRRSSKTVNGVTTNYVYSGQNLIEERDGSGAVLKKYLYAGGVDHPVQAVIGGSVYYFTQDVLGNVTALTDASGAIVESYTYDVFGKPVIKDGSGAVLTTALTPFLFTGREYDAETGLYHYRARAYSAELGRFLQNDPINFSAGDTNTYRYVSNAPTRLVDGLGLEAELITFSPVGSGKSSFGHTAINVNGTAYSFGENGWFSESMSDYMTRNGFRNAEGQVLDLTDDEEAALTDAIKKDMKRNPKWTPNNSCVFRARAMINEATGGKLEGAPATSYPSDLRNLMNGMGAVTQINYYPKTR